MISVTFASHLILPDCIVARGWFLMRFFRFRCSCRFCHGPGLPSRRITLLYYFPYGYYTLAENRCKDLFFEENNILDVSNKGMHISVQKIQIF